MVVFDGDGDRGDQRHRNPAPKRRLSRRCPACDCLGSQIELVALLTTALLPTSGDRGIRRRRSCRPTHQTPTAAGSVALAGLTLAPAVILLSEAFADSMTTSPPLALTEAPSAAAVHSPSMLATVVLTSTLVANAPATPTLLAPGAAGGAGDKLFLPAVGMTALTVKPLLLTLALSAMRA